MTVFRDFEPADAVDREPADPEQVARFLHERRRADALEAHGWDDLTLAQRVVLIAIVADVLAWLRRQGAG